MTNWVEWFRSQLQASGEGFIWSFQQIDADYLHKLPPDPGYMGKWTPSRHIWHITEYERCLAMPSMRQWLGGAIPGDDSWPDSDETWDAVTDRSREGLIAAFQAVRAEQIKLLDELASIDWNETRETVWGSKPLSMVVTKTYQHTFEHGDTLLRMSLWWKEAEEDIARDAANQTQPDAT